MLITGMSGTGKSTVVAELARRGFVAVDADDGYVDVLPDGRQDWNAHRIGALLDGHAGRTLFLAGCEEGMVEFLPRFDEIVLLSAPWRVLQERLLTRTSNPFGKQEDERIRIQRDTAEVEPRLRDICTIEIVTTAPIEQTVDGLLEHCFAPRGQT